MNICLSTLVLHKQPVLPLEKNGFIIVDVDREKIEINFYAWRPPEPEDAIDDLKPHYTVRYAVPWNPSAHSAKKAKTGR